MQPAISQLSSDASGALVLMRFRPAWAYIDGIREFGRFFCKTTFGTEELAERACVIIQETLENAVKYSSNSADSELELKIQAEGERIVFSVSSLPDPAHAARLRSELSGLHSLDAEKAYLAAFQRASDEPDAAARLGPRARIRYEGNVELSLKEEGGGRIRITRRGQTMTQLEKVAPPRLETLRVQIASPTSLVFSGTITSKDPAGDVGPFLKAVHEAALVDKVTELRVDVSALSFVNSSAIRLFVDWAGWIKSSKNGSYKLRFATNRHVTWQKTSFMALKSLAEDVLSIEQVRLMQRSGEVQDLLGLLAVPRHSEPNVPAARRIGDEPSGSFRKASETFRMPPSSGAGSRPQPEAFDSKSPRCVCLVRVLCSPGSDSLEATHRFLSGYAASKISSRKSRNASAWPLMSFCRMAWNYSSMADEVAIEILELPEIFSLFCVTNETITPRIGMLTEHIGKIPTERRSHPGRRDAALRGWGSRCVRRCSVWRVSCMR